MCEHCGCRSVEPIAELMDEHDQFLGLARDIRHRLRDDDRAAVLALLTDLGRRLDAHVVVEERGVFAALKDSGEYVEAVLDLERDHVGFDAQLHALDPRATDFEHRVKQLLSELTLHIEKENLGVFPVTLVTLSAAGWATVDRAHAERDEPAPVPA